MDGPPDPFPILNRLFWLLCLVCIGFYYFAARREIARLTPRDEPRRATANRYIARFSLAVAVPWLVMGWAQLVGAVPSIWYYFRPQERNPYVLAWLGSLFALAVAYAYWVFLCDGARKLRELHLLRAVGLGFADRLPDGVIKLIAAIGPFWVLLWGYVAVHSNAPIPR